jgi:hypothetical protein
MAHEGLQCSCIDSASRQGVSGSMAQHVRVDREWQPSCLAKPFNELLRTIDGKGRLALRQEHEVCVRMLAPELPQQPQLVTLQAVDAGRTVLGAADMNGRGIEINLLPETRKACRKAIRISSRSRTGLRLLLTVASRVSISLSVRYSRCR